MLDLVRKWQQVSRKKGWRSGRKGGTTARRSRGGSLLRLEALEDRRLLSATVTTTTLQAFSPTSQYGQPVELVAKATTTPASHRGNGPTGTVTFYLGSPTATTPDVLGTANVTQRGAAVLDNESSPLPVGSGETITAVYTPANANFLTSQGTVEVTVNPASTHTVVYASPNPGVVGAGVTFTAVVSSAAPHWANNGGTIAPPSGAVTFSVNGVTETGTFVGDSGISEIYTYTTSTLTAGTNTVSATVAADANYLGSTSNTLDLQAVSAAAAGTGTVATSSTSTTSPTTATLRGGQTLTIVSTATAVSSVTYVDSANGIDLASTTIASVVFDSNGTEAEITGTGTNTDGSTTTSVNFTLLVSSASKGRWSSHPNVSISIVGNVTPTAPATAGLFYNQSGSFASGSSVTITETGSTATIPPGGGLPGAHDRVLQTWRGDEGGFGGGFGSGFGGGLGSAFGGGLVGGFGGQHRTRL